MSTKIWAILYGEILKFIEKIIESKNTDKKKKKVEKSANVGVEKFEAKFSIRNFR